MDTCVLTLLKQLSFSAELPEAVLAKIAALAKLREFSAGEVLFREGSLFEQLLIVVTGNVALDMQIPGRGNVRILSLGPGDVVAWSAIIGGGRMTTSGTVLEGTALLSIPARDLLAMCDSDPALGYTLMRQVSLALANRLVATRLQLLDLFSDNPAPIPLRSI